VKSLLQILQPHRQYRIARNQQRRQERDQKRKRAAPAPIADNIIIPPKPALCCSFGINECTKLLERRIKHRQQQQQLQSTIEVEDISSTQSPLLLFVCVDDVVIAPHMISHLPTLAHLASNVYLCPLPKGTESRLGDASGMKRVCCLAIVCGDDDSSKLTADGRESINDLLMAVKAHWA
jgi:hypothetical protein